MQKALLLLTRVQLHLALLNRMLIQPWFNCNTQVHYLSFSSTRKQDDSLYHTGRTGAVARLESQILLGLNINEALMALIP